MLRYANDAFTSAPKAAGLSLSRITQPGHFPHLELKNVKKPREVKEMIHRAVEEAKEKRSMRTMEIMGGANGGGEMKEMDLFDEEHLLDDDISE